MKLHLLILLLVLITFSLKAQIVKKNTNDSNSLSVIESQSSYTGSYYDNINPNLNTFISDLKNRIRNPYNWVPYSQYDETILANYESFDNGNGTRSVFCVYSNDEYSYSGIFQWLLFSREHTFPHSWMPTNPANEPIERDEYADQHHLFPTNQNNANFVRLNHPLGNVANITSTFGEAKFGTDGSGKTVYEPRDEHKGDAARAILYMIIRYDDIDDYDWGLNSVNTNSGKQQDLSILLDWHEQDPPDQWEIGRNNYIESIQYNRNPFVDHPEYVNYIDFYEVEYISSGLYFTEYVEGSSDNKALEIFNNTGSNINLTTANYKIEIYSNGSSTPASSINLSGTLADGNVFVVAHQSADVSILNVANLTTGNLNFDGNDVIALIKGSEVTDVIGQIGFNPGDEWGTGITSTKNNTIRRNSSIGNGDSDGFDIFIPSEEWIGFANDTFDGLGTHIVNAGPPTIGNIVRAIKIPSADENTVVSADITDDGSVSTVTLKYTIDGGSEFEVSMENTNGSNFDGTIPSSAYIDGSLLEYWVIAEDDGASSSTSLHQKIFIGITPIIKLHPVNAEGGLLHTNTYARIAGVATVGNGTFSSTYLDVNIQDNNAGITIYKNDAGSTTIIRGNNYVVEGKLAQYKGKAEIVPDNASIDISDEGTGILPEPLILSISELLLNPEIYEGMLVKIQQISNTNNGDAWTTTTGSKNIEISDDGGTNVLTMRIDSDTDIDGTPEPNWPKDIVGIFNQYATYAPYIWGYQILPRDLNDFSNSVTVQIKVFLEGSYNSSTDEMFTSLNNSIPLKSPYSEDPRKVINISDDIIDWVLVELRTSENGEAIVSHSALLHKDGRIVADNGTSSTIRLKAEPNEYFIVVKHRNHLPVMSAIKINLSNN